jgi:glycosyltransferase involved in cell wall biosynthesis
MITTWECLSYREDMFRFRGIKGFVYREVTRGLDMTTGLLDRKIIAVSRQVAEHNARALGTDRARVEVLYNAFDPSRIVELVEDERAQLLRSLGLAGRGPILISVGRLSEQKRYDVSIAAMPALVARHPGIVLLIAGEGDLRGELSRQIERLGVQDHVRLLGRRTDVPTLLQVADAFVHSAEYEGNSLALLEALVAGLPVVTPRMPSSVEVVDGMDSVRLFEPLDSNDLAAAVSEVIERPHELRALARKNAQDVQRRFSAEVMAEGFWAIAQAAMVGDRN